MLALVAVHTELIRGVQTDHGGIQGAWPHPRVESWHSYCALLGVHQAGQNFHEIHHWLIENAALRAGVQVLRRAPDLRRIEQGISAVVGK